MGGGKGDAPPAPDYSAVIAASQQAQAYSAQVSKEQLAWAKEVYADNKVVSDEVADLALGVMERNAYNAQKDRQRYETIFQPLEEQLAYEAESYASPQRQETAAGAAEADVAQQFEQARRVAQERLESYGVDPSQTRAGALDLGSRVAEAAAAASAGNQARAQTEQIGRALRSEAINVGKGYPGQIAGTTGTSQQSGNQAVNTGLATTASGAQTMGTGTQWQGLANQATGQWGELLNKQFQNQLDSWKADQSQSSGWAGMLGQVGGALVGGLFEEGGEVPPSAIPPRHFARGGDPALPPGIAMPTTPAPPAGSVIPPEASPTRGQVTDDVPYDVSDGGQAKLNVGEFVFPEDVTRWLGEDKLQKMIAKAREQKANAQAQPEFETPEGAPPEGGPPPGMWRGGAIPARRAA